MRVAVVGGGISGLVSAYSLAKNGVQVVLYEKENYLGGHAKTVTFDGVDLDLGFMVFNQVTYTNMMEFFESLGVEMERTNMSFSVSLDNGKGCEWGTKNGFSGLFAQKKNLINPHFYQMIRETVKFKDDVISYLESFENNPGIDRNETLGEFIKSHGYSEFFQKAYLIPMCSSIWCYPSEGVTSFSAFSVLLLLRNRPNLQFFGQPQWLTVKGGSQSFVEKVTEALESRGCQIRSRCEVHMISTTDEGGCIVHSENGCKEMYDRCILAVHAPNALTILGDQATPDERRVLGAFQYAHIDIYLHCDKKLMPQNSSAWSAWNFLGNTRDNKVCLTYWLNDHQNLDETKLPLFVTLNPEEAPKNTLLKWSKSHSIPSVAASKASLELHRIQGNRGIWFCGAYQGYGFHEDGLKAGISAANGIHGKSCDLQSNPKQMVPSFVETGARLLVTRFLRNFISAGCLIVLEEGGSVFTFEGSTKKCPYKTVIKVRSPQFYWKVMTQADLGLADAYINGDFSFADKDQGLLNLFLILIASKDSNPRVPKSNKKSLRGWWNPMLLTASLASGMYFFRHVLRRNTLTQSRRNISRHYDVGNEFFAMFLDETMTYSTGIFKTEDEDLKTAQLRKISSLIEKARIEKHHEVLDIGSGWGSFAIEVVKQTGCKYTGITLSEEQLKFAQQKVKEAGLEDNIRFLLCHYRQLPAGYKCDRIISCEMIEHVGHEYMGEFFNSCESVLSENGLFVLQFISMADEQYDEYRRSAGFIKEYIFPGGCLPSLSRVTSAMADSSRFSIEHVENIGIHYYKTLRCWRKNLLSHQREIFDLGFDEKFLRTWEYYFDYCASGFKSRILGDYQIVFSRPGNVAVLGDPFPSPC